MSSAILKITRTFNAPHDLVWECWTDIRHVAKWLRPPGSKEKPDFQPKSDFRVGGQSLFCTVSPDGTEIYGLARYIEINPKDKVVYVHSFSDENANVCRNPMMPTWPLERLTTLIFVPEDDKTTVTLIWEPFNAPQEDIDTFVASLDGCAIGLKATFENLDRYLMEKQS
ncbi:MAG: SRPBCC family protein [Fimbriimonadaceae bacterium]